MPLTPPDLGQSRIETCALGGISCANFDMLILNLMAMGPKGEELSRHFINNIILSRHLNKIKSHIKFYPIELVVGILSL